MEYENYLTVNEVAAQCGIKLDRVYRDIQAGRLPALNVKEYQVKTVRYLVSKEALPAYAEHQTARRVLKARLEEA